MRRVRFEEPMERNRYESNHSRDSQIFYDEQCENIRYSKALWSRESFEPIDNCERIIHGIPNPPEIEFGSEKAMYVPTLDIVSMPKPEYFPTTGHYYTTLFHELIHSTGHDSRLSRDPIPFPVPHEPKLFAREELVAEMGSAFLCGYAGIENDVIDESYKSVE